MRFVTIVVTLTGAAQQLTLMAGGKTPIRNVSFMAAAANTGVVHIGDSSVSTSVWSFLIPIPVTNIPAAPMIPPDFSPACMYLEDYWVRGTTNEKLHLGVWVNI